MSDVVREVADATLGLTASVPGPAWARIERDALRRSLANILTNAEVHGGPPIDIEVAADVEWVTIVVWDHGPGVPEDLEAAVFEPFTRAVVAADRPGAGMGLAIVATIVERNGGVCSVQRDRDRFGVRIALPAAPGPAEAGRQARRRKAATGSGKPLTSTAGSRSTASGPATSASRASSRTSPGSPTVTSRAARLTTEP